MDDSAKAKVSTVQAQKRPPPEKPESISLRTKIVCSFWAVILLLGLPTWYQTTSIYRAKLPLQQMLEWADGVTGLPTIPLPIWVRTEGYSCSEAEQVLRETQTALDDFNEFPVLHQRLRLVYNSRLPAGAGIKGCGDDVAAELSGSPPALELRIGVLDGRLGFQLQEPNTNKLLYTSTSTSTSLSIDTAKAIQNLFSSEQIAVALRVNNLISNVQSSANFLKAQDPASVNDIHHQISRASKSSPVQHLTFSLFTAGGAPSSWDIQYALDKHIHPLVHALENTTDIRIATQVQLFSSFSPAIHPFQIEGDESILIKQQDLGAFVNAAEWPLSPSVGNGPTLNFILFVPDRTHIPLKIEGMNDASWIVPQWGAISILNPPLTPHPINGVLTVPAHLSSDLISQNFEQFSAQLLSLLGVVSSSFEGQPLPLSMRLQAHQRLAALTLHLKAASSLSSLARLAQRLSSIPIPKHVSQLVDNATGDLTSSTKAFNDGRWIDAMQYASSAYADSEKAFFDKAMVGQVYFPDEHKVAVYLPLLGPIGVPLFVGLTREVQRLLTRFKK